MTLKGERGIVSMHFFLLSTLAVSIQNYHPAFSRYYISKLDIVMYLLVIFFGA